MASGFISNSPGTHQRTPTETDRRKTSATIYRLNSIARPKRKSPPKNQSEVRSSFLRIKNEMDGAESKIITALTSPGQSAPQRAQAALGPLQQYNQAARRLDNPKKISKDAVSALALLQGLSDRSEPSNASTPADTAEHKAQTTNILKRSKAETTTAAPGSISPAIAPPIIPSSEPPAEVVPTPQAQPPSQTPMPFVGMP